MGVMKVGSQEICVTQICPPQVGSAEVRKAQMGRDKVRSAQDYVAKIRETRQLCAWETGAR
jgi:hypothetical protein